MSRRESYWDQYDFIDQNPLCSKRAAPENNTDDNECKLKELLNDFWFRALAATIKSNPESKRYLGPAQYRDENTFPRRSLIFRALNIHNNGNHTLHARDWKVIVLADLNIQHWTSKHHSNASVHYFLYNLLQFYGLTDIDDSDIDSDAMQRLLDEITAKYGALCGIPSPHEWIQSVMEQGVMFLYQCLTVGGSKDNEQHYRYWKPVVRAILYSVLSAKKNLKRRDGQKGTLLVVFDKKSKQFVRSVQSQIPSNKRTPVRVLYMEYDLHLDVKRRFHSIRFMQSINAALKEMNMHEIRWLDDEVVSKLRQHIMRRNSNSNKMKKRKLANLEEDEEEENVVSSGPSVKRRKLNVVTLDNEEEEEFSC